jgi:hypothetical protein
MRITEGSASPVPLLYEPSTPFLLDSISTARPFLSLLVSLALAFTLCLLSLLLCPHQDLEELLVDRLAPVAALHLEDEDHALLFAAGVEPGAPAGRQPPKVPAESSQVRVARVLRVYLGVEDLLAVVWREKLEEVYLAARLIDDALDILADVVRGLLDVDEVGLGRGEVVAEGIEQAAELVVEELVWAAGAAVGRVAPAPACGVEALELLGGEASGEPAGVVEVTEGVPHVTGMLVVVLAYVISEAPHKSSSPLEWSAIGGSALRCAHRESKNSPSSM